MKYTPPVLSKFAKSLTQSLLSRAALVAITSVLMAPLTQAASITKAGSGTDLTDGASWGGSVAPTASDVAVWDTGSLGTGLTLNSGTPSWLGITVNAGASDPINIASGGTLTLGTSGVNLSASAINATFGCDLSLASGYQSWSVASGKTLALNGNLTRAAGASMSFPTAGVTSTTLANDSTGILGGWATVTGTLDWATNSAATGVGTYAGYTSVTGTLAPNAAQNWKNTGTVTLSGSGTINSMNVVGGDLAVGANTLTLGSGGLILGSSERWVTGTGGTIQSGLATGELYIHANTTAFANGFQIQPKIINNLASTAVIKDGSGQVEMGNGASTFSGGFYLNAGSVYLGTNSTGSGGAPSQGPLGTGTVTINGGTLNVWGKNSGTTTTAGYTLANNIYIPAGASATINNGGQNGVLSGVVSGVVPTFLGAGITALQGVNTYSGNTTITVGTLGVGNVNGANNNLSSGDVIVNTNSTLRVGYSVTSNGNRTYTANNITLAGGRLYADDAWQYITGNINVTSNSIVGSTYNNAGGEQDKGLFLGGVLSGSAALTVQHSGISTANASYITSFVAITNNANTYSGTITINENTSGSQGGVYLGVNGSTALANATINVPGPVVGSSVKFGTSPLVFSSDLGGNATLGALVGSGPVILSGYNEVSHAYVGNIALTVGNNNATTNFAGVLSGGGSLIKAGSGTYTLTGTNTYTGATTVSAGTLTIGGAGLLGNGNYSGAIINNGSLNYDSSAAQILAGPISGSGTLTILGSRALTLGGLQNSSPNTVTVNDGAALNEAFSSAAQLAPTSLTVGNTTGASLGFVPNSTSVARMAPGTLTLNGTATINILGGNLVAGSSYPLITYTTLAGSGSYALGAVPNGVGGNLSTSGNTIYFNVTGVTNTVWTGVVNGTWDINTTANWTNTGTLGNKYIDGSMIQFDDTGINTTTISNAVATTLKPGNVLVTNNTLNYSFKTNTIIAGNAGLTKTGTANLTNSTPNTYTGPTTINKGQVVAGVASVANVSGALGNNSAVTLANDATAALNLNNFATQVGSLSGGGSTGGNVALGSATLTAGADNSSTTYAGAIAGTGGLTKIGTGTLTLSGTNTATGSYSVNNGALVVTGNGTINATTNPAGRVLVGTVSGSSGALYQNGANSLVCIGNSGGFGQLGSTAGASGYYKLSTGSLVITNGGELDPGGSSGGAGTFGQFDMSGGTVYVGQTNGTGSTYFLPNRGASGESSVVNFNGGTFLINSNMVESATFAGYEVNWAAGSQTNATTISGNAVFASPSVSVKLNQANNAGNVCSLNLNGGLFQTLGLTPAHCASAVVNFNGGTLKAGNSANANFMGNVASVYSYGAGGTIDNNGLAISIGQAFSSPSGNGVASIAVGTAGSGYIVPPQVTIVGDGTGATAYSTVDPVSGAVTGIIVTCPGTGYSTASASLAGGGGSGATAGTVALAANTSGAMTFTGAGTTTLNGAFNSTGGLKILGGTLSLTPANGIAANSDLVLSGSTLTLGLIGGGQFSAGSIFLTNGTISLTYGTVIVNPSTAAIYSSSGSLSRSGTTTINISAAGLGLGVIPLIVAPGLNTTNGFAIGSLPSGVNGVLTNSVSGELDLLVTSAGQLLLWHGTYDGTALLTNWDINVSTNWYDSSFNLAKYLQYAGNTIGDNVIFGDNGYNVDGTNRVNLPANVLPATVEFYTSTPYILSGPGGIGGGTSVLLTNVNNTIYLLTSNSYSGGTFIGSGVLAITNNSALGATAGGVTLGGGTLQLNSSVTSSRSVAVSANSSIGVVTNATAQFGTITGTANLTKLDNGTLALPGTNSLGTLIVQQGAVTSTGTNVVSGVPLIGNLSGYNAVLNVAGGVFQDNNNPAQVFNTSLTIGNTAGAAGNMIVSGGTVNIPKQLTVGPTTYGAFNQSSGTTTIGGYIAVGGTASGGVFNQSGGTVNVTNAPVTIGYVANTSVAVMNLSGTAVLNMTGPAGSQIQPGEVGSGTLNVSGSAVLTIANDGVVLGKNNAAGVGTLNLLGGVVTANSVSKGVGTGRLNFNGGTLKANVASTTFMNGLNGAYVYSGGAIIDDGGFAITIAQPLLLPNDYGVSSILLSDGGSGYISAPVVTISGGSGSNATAVATVSGGTVTGVTITSPGIGYNSGDSLSVSFAGGGASVVSPTVSSVNLAANTSGGLLKRGAGTVTLSGANTYTGPTVVTNGVMLLTPTYQAGGAVTVADGAAFGVSANSASNSATIGTLTLGSSGNSTLDFNYSFGGNPTNAALTAGAVTINGTASIAIGGSFALGSFPVLKYTSLSGTFNSSVTAPRGMVATVSNDVPDKILYVVVSSLSSPIVWTGTNSLAGKTNLWDLNTTTNWLIGAVPTTYQETLPPGDAVVFNDIGSGTVLLSNTASPSTVTISNSSVNYTFQGSGQINAVAGLTKVGSGTVTLNVPGTYSISTVVSNGTLVLGTNQTFGNLLGNGTLTNTAGSPMVTVNNSANTTFAGGVQGSLGVTKTGNGTLTLTGTNNFSGNVFGKGGTLILDNGAINGGTLWTSIAQDGTDTATLTLKGTAIFTNNADFNVGDIGSAAGTLNISNSATLAVGSMYIGSANVAGSTASGTVNQGGGTVQNTLLVIGGRTSTNGVGIYNLSNGTVTGSGSVRIGGLGTGTMNISGTGAASFPSDSYVGYRTGKGTLNMTGGSLSIGGDFRVGGSDLNGTGINATGIVTVANATLNLGSLTLARGNNNQNGCSGEVYVNSGATVTSTNDVTIGFAGTGHAKLAVNGGVFNVGVTNTKWLIIPQYDTTTGEIDITNGSLNLNAGSAIRFSRGNTSTAGTPNMINQEGGNVTFYSDFATTIGGGGVLDLAYSGAASAVNTYNLDGGTLTVPQVLSTITGPTRVFNFNGGTLKAAGSSAAFFNLGGGNAFAYVRAGGAIIDTWSNSVTVAQALLNNGVDEDGGLTKIGNGTLLLNGVNTYTNTTTVNAGLLGGAGTIAGPLVVNNGGGVSPGNGIGTLTVNGNITLNAGSTNAFEVNGSTLAHDTITAGGNVTYGGVLNIVTSGTFTNGQTFTLFSGAGAASASNFSSIQTTPASSVVFSFTNGVLTVVSAGAPSQPVITSIGISGSTLTISGTNGTSGQQFRVLSSTNLTLPIASWTPIYTNTFTGSPFNATVPITLAVPQDFYMISIP